MNGGKLRITAIGTGSMSSIIVTLNPSYIGAKILLAI